MVHATQKNRRYDCMLYCVLLCSIVFFFHSTLKDMPEFDMKRAYAIHKGTGALEIVDVNCSWSCWELGGK
jgi:multidrug transporter EmrE-like cation transporter